MPIWCCVTTFWRHWACETLVSSLRSLDSLGTRDWYEVGVVVVEFWPVHSFDHSVRWYQPQHQRRLHNFSKLCSVWTTVGIDRGIDSDHRDLVNLVTITHYHLPTPVTGSVPSNPTCGGGIYSRKTMAITQGPHPKIMFRTDYLFHLSHRYSLFSKVSWFFQVYNWKSFSSVTPMLQPHLGHIRIPG